ncbi:hypothetical protein ACVRZR_05285 [Streptococcus entericus]|uniref:hypothetical protein n=1 Tax=Streptococcus entericus TaxID=155680 RepID=UPI00039B00D9|nr:hypothetical protein [Streptococcus entericus]
MDNFMTLEAVFADAVFQEMFEEMKPVKVTSLDPEVEKFQALLDWVREQGRAPLATGSLAEKLKHRYLKGLRADESRKLRCLPYDELGLLGGDHDRLA